MRNLAWYAAWAVKSCSEVATGSGNHGVKTGLVIFPMRRLSASDVPEAYRHARICTICRDGRHICQLNSVCHPIGQYVACLGNEMDGL